MQYACKVSIIVQGVPEISVRTDRHTFDKMKLFMYDFFEIDPSSLLLMLFG